MKPLGRPPVHPPYLVRRSRELAAMGLCKKAISLRLLREEKVDVSPWTIRHWVEYATRAGA